MKTLQRDNLLKAKYWSEQAAKFEHELDIETQKQRAKLEGIEQGIEQGIKEGEIKSLLKKLKKQTYDISKLINEDDDFELLKPHANELAKYFKDHERDTEYNRDDIYREACLGKRVELGQLEFPQAEQQNLEGFMHPHNEPHQPYEETDFMGNEGHQS